MTIAEAIKQAIKTAGKLLTAQDSYDIIKAKNLYVFNAKNPRSFVSGTISKHCKVLSVKLVKTSTTFKQ